jgi:aminoglycoside phosphotransferase (APT) family kinase protein
VLNIESLIRPDRLGEVLAHRLGDESWRTLTARLISGGKSNLTFELLCSAGDLILRRPPTGVLARGAHDMGREVAVQSALKNTDVPVPDIVLAETDPELLGAPFYVMRRLPGVVVRDDLPVEWCSYPSRRGDVTRAIADTLASLHAVRPGDVGLADFGRPSGFAARQVRTWRRQYLAAQTRQIDVVDELHRLLEGYAWPEATRTVIVHGDYRLDNCLVDVASTRISGVLDWELSTLGDPMCDLAMLLFYWARPREPRPVLTPAVTALSGFGNRTELVDRYASVSGASLEGLNAYVALAHFKFVGIAQGIAERVAADQMAGQDFGDLDAEIDRIASAGLAMMKGEAHDGFWTL